MPWSPRSRVRAHRGTRGHLPCWSAWSLEPRAPGPWPSPSQCGGSLPSPETEKPLTLDLKGSRQAPPPRVCAHTHVQTRPGALCARTVTHVVHCHVGPTARGWEARSGACRDTRNGGPRGRPRGSTHGCGVALAGAGSLQTLSHAGRTWLPVGGHTAGGGPAASGHRGA